MSDRVLALVHRNVKRMVDEQAGIARPLVVYAVGGQTYIDMKSAVADNLMAKLPDTMRYVESYAEDAMDIRTTLVSRMRQLTPQEFEGMLRPAFQQDEWILIMVGGVLGVLVGELQIHLMLPFFR
jgi:uncharacterized membrane protein YheB (UPF0754 family)